jgi:hypothetical protein
MALSLVCDYCDMFKYMINERLKDTEPAHILVLTAGAAFALAYLYLQLTDKVWSVLQKFFFGQ